MFIVAWRYDGKRYCPECFRKLQLPMDNTTAEYLTETQPEPIFAYDYMKRGSLCATCGVSVKWHNSRSN